MSDPIRVLIVSEQHADPEPALAALRRAGLDPTCHQVHTEAAYAASLVPELDVILAGATVPALTPARALDLLRASRLDVPFIVAAPALSAEHVASLFRHGATDCVTTERLERLGTAVIEARTARREREEQRSRALAVEAAAAEARRRNDESFRLLFASNPLPMWVYDIETLYFLEVNDAAVSHYGYTRVEFLKMRSTDIRPPEEAARFEARVAELSAEPRQIVRRSAPWRHRLKDGTIREMDTAGHALEFGGRRAMLVVAMDITDLNRAQEALGRSNTRLQILLEIARALIAAEEPAAVAEAALRSLQDLLGVARASVSLFDLEAGEAERLAAVGRRQVRAGAGLRFPIAQMGDVAALLRGELQALRTAVLPAGPHTQILLASGVQSYVVVPMIATGELIGAVNFEGELADFSDEQLGIAREVATQLAILVAQARLRERIARQAEELERRVQARTAELSSANGQLQREIGERRRAEDEASRANRAKSEFLSRMSHELRTPLNGILGFAQLLDLDVRDPDERESVQHILKGGRHLLALIDEILDIARIEAGRLHISLEPVLVSDTVRSALDLVRPQATARGIILGGDAHEHEAYVTADRQRLQQVLLNLLSNAVKYNREGGTVTVSCRERAEGRIGIAVRDTGVGIAADKLERLFTPFDRLGAEQGDVQGTGLGLALSKGLVDAMSGRLLVESRVGVGTTFTVELPAADGSAADGLGLERPVPAAAPPRVEGTILYIEDNVANLRLFERIIGRRPGVTLLSAMQGSQGIELARTHRPRLVILDLHLPDVHGEVVLARLQEDPLTREIPVVILSADAIPGDISRLLAQGARAYLTKPLDVAQFLSLLDEILTTSKA